MATPGITTWQVQADHEGGRSILVRASTQAAAREVTCRVVGIAMKDAQ